MRRSARRRRTVSAFWRDGVPVVAIPGHFTAAQEREWVEKMLARLRAKAQGRPGALAGEGTSAGEGAAAGERHGAGDGASSREGRRDGAGRRPASADPELMRRAENLSQRYLGGRSRPSSVRWVSNQNQRWGSATPARGTIRLSDKLTGMPQWVVDYVLLHELAHLIVSSHSAAFWKLLSEYPHLERAKAFLNGVSFAESRGLAEPGGLDGRTSADDVAPDSDPLDDDIAAGYDIAAGERAN